MDSDSDDESQLEDLNQLVAALEADDDPDSEISSQLATSTVSLCAPSAEQQQRAANIDTALALNKLTDEKMQRLERALTNRLRECRQRLSAIRDDVPRYDATKQDKHFRYVSCGKPYFRDQSNFPAPDNDDTILMKKAGMYDFSLVTSVPGWTVKDKSEFTRLLLKMTQEKLKNELLSKKTQLQREAKGNNTKETDKQISKIMQEINALSRKTLSELALPIDQEYDWDFVATSLNRRHNAQEYQALWKLFLHPSINKTSWTKQEHLTLQKLAHNNNMQDWEKITTLLNTGRTAYQCFVYFRTNMSNTFTGQKWTKEEEEYLKRLTDYYREDDYIPWGKVAQAMENRTKIQVYNKYARLAEQRKGRFLPEEDAVLLNCVNKFGKNFRRIAIFLPGRSAIQLRTRFQVLSKAARISIVWSAEEDKKLIQIMANQDSTTNYSSITKHFPGKDRVHIRARYVTLVKWMRKHPNLDISKAPRRGARRLCHGIPSQNLNKAVENLKIRIQTEVENKKKEKIKRDSPDETLEDAIIATLVNENVKEEETKRNELYDDERIVLNEEFTTFKKSHNVTNLNKTLLLLKSSLDKTTFDKSKYAQDYPGLLAVDTESCLVKVKSYSRKEKIKTIQLEGVPDIWGNKKIETSEYVFPPNYDTITGCRKLMAYVTAKFPKEYRCPSFNNIAKRNIFFKEEMDKLMERFTSLFLWPMILSNEEPKPKTAVALTNKPRPRFEFLPGDPGVTIPIKGANIVNTSIDLATCDSDDSEVNEIDVKDFHMGHDAFE